MSDLSFDPFERLKKKTFNLSQSKKPEEIFFMLDFDDHGAFIQIVDGKLKPTKVIYNNYNGAVRDAVRTINNIGERNDFVIDWEKQSETIYLAENDFLLRQLKDCGNLLTKDGVLIHFNKGEANLTLQISELESGKSGRLRLEHEGMISYVSKFLNENHVFSEDQIYEVKPLGANFNHLPYFVTQFGNQDLEKFMSLAWSTFENLQIQYLDFKVKLSKETIPALPSLIFEKIDADNSLYLKVCHTLKGFEIDLLSKYEISHLARLNEMEKTIFINEISDQDNYDIISQISKMLDKHAKKKKSLIYEVDENLLIIDEEIAKEFITKDLPSLLGKFELFGAEKLKAYKVRPVFPKLKLNLSYGIDFLEGDASLDIGGENFSLFDAINQFRKNSYISLSDGTSAIIREEYIKKLERIFKKKKNGVKLSFFDLPLVEELLESNQENHVFNKSREVFEGFNLLQSKKTKLPKVNATLRPYQEQGFKWLDYLHDHQLGGCLADDMGLGKTLQAITLLSKIYPKQKQPSIIVMPKSLLFNWENELAKFNPNLSFYTFYGNNRDLLEAQKHQLILTTYAMVRNEVKGLKDVPFYYVILDESQNIKNINTQSAQSVMLLQSKHRLALSGTPIENNLNELYSLFRFLNPSMFGSENDFNLHYSGPIQKNNDKDAIQQLRKKIYPFILRRLKKDVLKELPDKMEHTIFVEMSEDQKKLYEQRRRYFFESVQNQIKDQGVQKSQFVILQALSELRQIASIPESRTDGMIISPKREVLIDQVLDAAANGHKILIFANFIAAIEVIGEELEKAGIDYVSMTGATRDRQALVNRFQNDPECQVFLMTLKTGGVGLNLTAADMVFIFDPWWNKAAENQAIDRAHRIGQQNTVMSYKLITKGTIEEKILLLQEKKRALLESIVSSDSASIKSLTEKDVEFILG
ncbi:DEAD/DEAH box helicase [Rhodonellum sp.]|uniref:DEAD/DEAH box helicase n=1 Tax=Rhodonellum sp. TaxID=2231180 RepID=UPI00271DD62A|nr:SNF2-related protein [Rhodonellum sp.]MDO9553865.1 SNF2-related protein [Rhodonellum sp.]